MAHHIHIKDVTCLDGGDINAVIAGELAPKIQKLLATEFCDGATAKELCNALKISVRKHKRHVTQALYAGNRIWCARILPDTPTSAVVWRQYSDCFATSQLCLSSSDKEVKEVQKVVLMDLNTQKYNIWVSWLHKDVKMITFANRSANTTETEETRRPFLGTKHGSNALLLWELFSVATNSDTNTEIFVCSTNKMVTEVVTELLLDGPLTKCKPSISVVSDWNELKILL